METIKSIKATRARIKPFIRLGCFCVSPIALIFLFFCWYFWSNAEVYSDRPALLSAMLRLQLGKEKVVSIGGRSDVLLLKTYKHQDALDGYFKVLGWSRVDWMGAEGQSRKGTQIMRVVNLAMTRYFRIIGLGHSPYIVRGTKR